MYRRNVQWPTAHLSDQSWRTCEPRDMICLFIRRQHFTQLYVLSLDDFLIQAQSSLKQLVSYRSILRFKSTVWSAQITREIFALLKSNAPSAQTTKVFLVLKATREVRRINWRIGQPLQSVRVRKTHFYIKFCRHFYRNDGPFNSSDIKLDSNPLITNY